MDQSSSPDNPLAERVEELTGANGDIITEGAEAMRPPVSTPVTPEKPPKGRVDLTQGHLLRGIVLLSWPIVSGAVLNWIMGVADIKMVGRLGPDAIAAVGQSQLVIFTVQFVIFAVATGTQVLVARYTGAREPHRVAAVTRQSIIISFLAGVPMIPVGLLVSRALLAWLGAEGDVLDLGVVYTHAMFWGSVGMMLNFLLASSLQGAGDTITPLLMLIWINLAHIALEYCMIFGVGPFPAMGVAGAGWAVVITRGLAAGVMLWVVMSGRFAVTVPWRGPWRIDWSVWGKMFYIGTPSSMQGLVRNLGYALLIAILNRTAAGKFAVAGHITAGQWSFLGILIGLAMMTAAMTAVGQNMGAKNPRRAEQSCWSVVAISSVTSGALALLCIVFARPLVGFFTDDPQALYWGHWALVYIAASLPFATISMAFSGGLRGAGDTMSPLWATLVGTLAIGPVLAWYLALHTSVGPAGVWIGMVASMVAQALYTGIIFQRGRWKTIEL
jgi:putative MATE family efflux protein